ncbi:MauE/DoxX family redox-associated membrane protein [Streptosporangium sp. CA-115845]|uniref:MauE/DoxX family redox-associated membrane protein n=1 Tax=Streptosporangium sp. CA-115845 TaxID=3240071 RepID=UPI003D8ABB8E
MNYLEIGIRCLIGVVFVSSFIGKAANRDATNAFVESVRDMRLLPQTLARPVALGVMAAELAACVLLVVPTPTAAVAGFTIAAGLLIIFTISIALTLRRGAHIPCRCFGVSTTTPLGIQHIMRNIALTAFALMGAAVTPATGPVEAGGVAIAVFGGLILGGLFTVIDDLVELFKPIAESTGASHSPR